MQKLIASSSTHLILALDFGGSGLKGIYQLVGAETSQTLFMEAQTFAATLESLQEKTDGNLDKVYPENLAWVGIDGDYRAVGYLAVTRYLSNPELSKKKYSLAVYRTLAAIWVVQQKLKLPEQIKVSLGVLLPPGEFEDAHTLAKLLQKACLSGFTTPTGKMRVSLNFQCYPEGGGVYLLHTFKNSEQTKRTTVGIAMIGYRNASVLISQRGMINQGKTSNLGMVRLIELVLEKTSGLTTEELLKAIVTAGNNIEPYDFYSLTESGIAPELRRLEAKKITEALIRSRSEYLNSLTIWLSEVLPKALDEIIFCGGTADYLKVQLNDFFSAISLKWHSDFILPKKWQHQWLGNRLADVYGVFLVLSKASQALITEEVVCE